MAPKKLLVLWCAASLLVSCDDSTVPTELPSVQTKQAGHAVVIPRGSVTVDGTMGPDEWGSALPLPLTIPIVGGTSVSADLRLANDGENLYASVHVPVTDIVVVLGIGYDNNRNGVADNGEDFVAVNTQGSIVDMYNVSCGPGPCAGAHDNSVDVDFAWRQTADAVELELSHPLADGDVNDIAVGPNGKMSANILVSLIGPEQYLGFRYYPGGISANFGAFRIGRH